VIPFTYASYMLHTHNLKVILYSNFSVLAFCKTHPMQSVVEFCPCGIILVLNKLGTWCISERFWTSGLGIPNLYARDVPLSMRVSRSFATV
jgi:hypothetical protein